MTKEDAIIAFTANTINGPHAEFWKNIIVDVEFMLKLHQAARARWGEEDYLTQLANLDTNKKVSWEVEGSCITCKIDAPNTFNIENTFYLKKKRNWPMLYVAIDLHGTVIKPEHDKIEFYTDAIKVIKWFNSRTDFKTILWTSSFQEELTKFKEECKKESIHFDFINENPLEANSKRACFDSKFYFNVLLDDKAGFNGNFDWTRIKNVLVEIGEW